MKHILLKPGAIILWKQYNTLQKFWAKLRRKELKCNKCCIIPYKMDLISVFDSLDSFRVFEPKKQYSSVEKDILNSELNKNVKHTSDEEYMFIVNIVRPNTFDPSSFTLDSLSNNKYYREVYAEEC